MSEKYSDLRNDFDELLIAARQVASAWPKGFSFCEEGSTLWRLNNAIAAMPADLTKTHVLVPAYVIGDLARVLELENMSRWAEILRRYVPANENREG